MIHVNHNRLEDVMKRLMITLSDEAVKNLASLPDQE